MCVLHCRGRVRRRAGSLGTRPGGDPWGLLDREALALGVVDDRLLEAVDRVIRGLRLLHDSSIGLFGQLVVSEVLERAPPEPLVPLRGLEEHVLVGLTAAAARDCEA